MKLIMAVIKPHRIERVRDALAAAGIHGMTVTDVRGYGRQRGHKEIYRGAEYDIAFVPKCKIEVAVADEVADKAVETIVNAAKTGAIGDGKLFVYDLDRAVRIRTGEEGPDAL